MIPSLDEALRRAREGDEVGFSAIYALLAGRVQQYLLSRQVWDPESLTNDVFLAVFRSLDTFAGSTDAFRGWVFTIARNKAIDDARRRARRPQESGQPVPDRVGGDVAEDVLAHLAEEWVQQQFALLTEDQREVLTLRLVDDLTVAQVAEIMDKPIDAVKALQRRALRRLGKKISDDPYPFSEPRR